MEARGREKFKCLSDCHPPQNAKLLFQLMRNAEKIEYNMKSTFPPLKHHHVTVTSYHDDWERTPNYIQGKARDPDNTTLPCILPCTSLLSTHPSRICLPSSQIPHISPARAGHNAGMPERTHCICFGRRPWSRQGCSSNCPDLMIRKANP